MMLNPRHPVVFNAEVKNTNLYKIEIKILFAFFENDNLDYITKS